MKRKKFIQLSAALAASALAVPFRTHGQKPGMKNWAENLEYSTSNVFYPKTVEEVRSTVKKLSKLRALGTRHCFNRIADSKDNLVSSAEMSKIISLDAKARTVTVEGGIRYGELAPYLDENGFALHNLASLPHISIAGSCATATHGSGVKNGNLATEIHALEMVIADGSVVELTRERDREKLQAAAVGLGALGVVTKVTLDLQPTFMMRQHVYEHLPMVQLKENFEKIMSAGYSVSLFTDWQSDSINEVWIKSRVEEAVDYSRKPEFFGARAATKNMHPIAANSAENCTEQMGVPGPWYKRMPHFKMGFMPSNGRELQSEYFVPRSQAVEAMLAVSRLSKQIGPHLFISEIRTIAADELWMSPCRKQDSVAIHFTWKQDWDAVSKLLPQIEKELEPFNLRPHWGKLFAMPAKKLASRYEMLADFRKLAAIYDPKGKFRNEFLDTTIFAGV